MFRAVHKHLPRAFACMLVSPLALLAQGGGRAKELPLKYAGPPTIAAITPGDLMTRLYLYADDSLMGRQFGTEYNLRATAYIEREVRRLGLKPAGDSGGYFQYVPTVRRTLEPASTITAEGTTFKAGVDFVSNSFGKPRQYANQPVVFGGMAFDTLNLLSNAAVRGNIVLMRPFAQPPGFNGQAYAQSAGYRAYQQAMAGAILVNIAGDQLSAAQLRNAMTPVVARFRSPQFDIETPITLTVTTRMAEALLGTSLASATKGATGKPLSSDVRFNDKPEFSRNVVAMLPGTDDALRGQFVAIGAHNDHVGYGFAPVDHDSLKAFMQIVRPQGADNAAVQPAAEQIDRVRVLVDSLHRLHGARPDSIFNGADDDGSGTVSVLEIAEAFARGSTKPKRSLIFVWHTGEEAGLIGSGWFTDHPTISRDSIVAQLNLDMVGRGSASDITGNSKDGGLLHGGPGYLQLVGSRRLSTELGDLIETVNKEMKLGFSFDYGMDANGHPQNIYCRSDHYEYARYGIPIVFMTTGGHADYHQVTDEPQYIDYAHMADVAKLVFSAALRVANLDHRVVVDQPKPDPKGRCVQ